MKQILLPGEDRGFFRCKANLHTHSTLSDGHLTPEEIKKEYAARGYGAVAFTDHNLFIPHNDLTDENFVALNGIEINTNDETKEGLRLQRCCHINLIALSPDVKSAPCTHRSLYYSPKSLKNKDLVEFDPDEPDFERAYTAENQSAVMERGREKGFFVTYNHPTWSRENYPQYSAYHGMHAVEIYNHHNAMLGFPEPGERVYDDLLKLGKRIFCTATDDCHAKIAPGEPLSDCFGGYTTLFVKKRTYEDLADALVHGRFFCGTGDHRGFGAEILSLVWEDGTVILREKGASFVTLQTDVRERQAQLADPEKETEIRFPVSDAPRFFRLTLTDPRGFFTYTRAYFTDELKKEGNP